ncbi:hypothetical protein [Paraburkholderia bannensis]|uniref:hypothetical protein n=1 Tax=Paraburkholderia bannensis TaxID=765414 RepID=UPI002ABE5EAE|nr:hypothetical protein [Paraburkholderia bannensis]
MAALNSLSATAAAIQSVTAQNLAVAYAKDAPTPQYLRDEIALRYRIPLEAARVGTRWLSAAAWISELLFLSAWFAHKGCGELPRDALLRLEYSLRKSIARGRVSGTFSLDQDAFESFVGVMEMYEFQLTSSTFGELEEGVRLMDVYRSAGLKGKPATSSRRRMGRA